jgi:hypothetical protein
VVVGKFFSGAAVAVSMLIGGVAVASPVWSAPRDSCSLYANNVTQQGKVVSGTGGRRGCSGRVNVGVLLYKEISFWPDKRIASAGEEGVYNTDITVAGTCDGNDPYYILAASSTGDSFESPHTEHC